MKLGDFVKAGGYEEGLKHFYDIEFLNELALKEYIKILRQENLELKTKIIDLEFKLKAKEIKKE